MSNEDFSKKIEVLFHGTIGQQVRHVLEFYLCVFSGIKNGSICYDERKRDLRLETDKAYAVQCLETILHKLENLENDAEIKLKVCLSKENNEFSAINSSIDRELVYCFDHSVHHQALIKIALQELQFNLDDDTFGIAPSTIKYMNSCAQ